MEFSRSQIHVLKKLELQYSFSLDKNCVCWPTSVCLGLTTKLGKWKGSTNIFPCYSNILNLSLYGLKPHPDRSGERSLSTKKSCTKWVIYLSRCVLYFLYEFLVFANFLYYFLVMMVFCKESINISLSFSGDQKIILVIEPEVFHRCCALSHDHFLDLPFVSFNNLIQNDRSQGGWFRGTFLNKGAKTTLVIGMPYITMPLKCLILR